VAKAKALPTYTISDKDAVARIRVVVDSIYDGPDEPINGCDAVDSIVEIKGILDATRFLLGKGGR